jgi:hypothetical protein
LEIPKEAAPHIVDTPSRAAASAPKSPPIENPSEIWKLGWAARGKYFDEHFRDGSLHPLSRTIDNFDAAGVATSIKSSDLNAATYQDFARLTSRLDKYIDKLKAYAGTNWGGDHVDPSAITGRVLRLIVPEGSVRTVQRAALEAAHIRAKNLGIDLIVTDF